MVASSAVKMAALKDAKKAVVLAAPKVVLLDLSAWQMAGPKVALKAA